MGAGALEPLASVVAQGSTVAKENAARALTKLAPSLSAAQRAAAISAAAQQLAVQNRNWQSMHQAFDPVDSLSEALVIALCTLDGQEASAEVRGALRIAAVGAVLLEHWRATRQPWLLELFAQGILHPDSRTRCLVVAAEDPADEALVEALWPAVETVLASETDAYRVSRAVACARAWKERRAVGPLQDLQARWSTLAGVPTMNDYLANELEQTLRELTKGRSILDRLRGH
jgi:hypothetical protein